MHYTSAVVLSEEKSTDSLETFRPIPMLTVLNGIDGLEIQVIRSLPEEQQDIDDAQNKTSD